MPDKCSILYGSCVRVKVGSIMGGVLMVKNGMVLGFFYRFGTRLGFTIVEMGMGLGFFYNSRVHMTLAVLGFF